MHCRCASLDQNLMHMQIGIGNFLLIMLFSNSQISPIANPHGGSLPIILNALPSILMYSGSKVGIKN